MSSSEGSGNTSEDALRSHQNDFSKGLLCFDEETLKKVVSDNNWDKESNDVMKAFLSKNKLNEKFGKFTGHGTRKAKQSEYIAFLKSLKEEMKSDRH